MSRSRTLFCACWEECLASDPKRPAEALVEWAETSIRRFTLCRIALRTVRTQQSRHMADLCRKAERHLTRWHRVFREAVQAKLSAPPSYSTDDRAMRDLERKMARLRERSDLCQIEFDRLALEVEAVLLVETMKT